MSVTRVKMLIGVLSCHKHSARREACLATWANIGGRDDVDLVFILGDGPQPAPRREGKLLHCPCPDDYNSLSLKTQMFCSWALANHDCEYIFKCDDDTYVHVDRLIACDTRGDYVGGDIPGYPHASGGAGYRLSRSAASQVSIRLNQRVFNEDYLVWIALSRANIRFQPDSRFGYNREPRPTKDNTQITCHWCSEQAMIEIHDSL